MTHALTIATLPLPFPFELRFMQRALVACVAVGVFAPMIGTFVVQKRLSLIGDGIGHVAFAGVGAGLLWGISPVGTALAFAVTGAIGVERLRVRRQASGDLALALFFYSGIALGVVLVSRAGGLSANILTYLFGQPLTVTRGELLVILVVGVVVALTVVSVLPALFAVVTDDEWARVAGLPVDLLNTVLAVLTAGAVVGAMRIVGILLVAALMVLPVASAQLLARSFRGTLAWSVVIGVGSSVVGLAATRFWNFATGGTIVLVSALVFAVVALAKRAVPGVFQRSDA
ncbi:MAG: metal ABC transporter permease [Actinomycetota bacterium]|nr:metal ABC transporter permease [Actinomycetota bacterium]